MTTKGDCISNYHRGRMLSTHFSIIMTIVIMMMMTTIETVVGAHNWNGNFIPFGRTSVDRTLSSPSPSTMVLGRYRDVPFPNECLLVVNDPKTSRGNPYHASQQHNLATTTGWGISQSTYAYLGLIRGGSSLDTEIMKHDDLESSSTTGAAEEEDNEEELSPKETSSSSAMEVSGSSVSPSSSTTTTTSTSRKKKGSRGNERQRRNRRSYRKEQQRRRYPITRQVPRPSNKHPTHRHRLVPQKEQTKGMRVNRHGQTGMNLRHLSLPKGRRKVPPQRQSHLLEPHQRCLHQR